MSEILDRQMDRYLRGELTPAESRELAQAALSDDALFDALAAHGAVEQSLKNADFRSALLTPGVKHFPRRSLGIALAAAAAAISVFALYLNSRSKSQPSQAVATVRPPATGKPIFIAKEFVANPNAPVFRSATPSTRAPQPEGVIVSQDNFEVTVNLGSLDGVQKGGRLDVLAGSSNQAVGRLEATTVFRDRARARIINGSAHEHDRVRVQPSAYLASAAEVMGSDRGLGHQAISWAMANDAPMDQIRPVLDRLALLDYQAGDLATAERDYQLILSNSPAPEDRAIALNNLGAIAEQRGQTATAEASYQEALRALGESSTPSALYRQTIESNIARLTGRSSREKR
jgi:tetratricopeptide (TPR) repeat protein